MSRNWQIHIAPASHLDYGWAASPGECLGYVSEVIRAAVAPSEDDPKAIVIRLVEFHGASRTVTLTLKRAVSKAEEVNFLERRVGVLAAKGKESRVRTRGHGIHSVKVWLHD